MPFAIDEAKMESPDFKAGSMDKGNPPIKAIPYQEFPRMIYNEKLSRPAKVNVAVNQITGAESEVHVPEKLATRIVRDQAELDKALEAGWSVKPPVMEAQIGDPEVIDTPRRGRPPKNQ